MPNTRLNVIHGRDYQVDGEQRTSWTIVGVGFMSGPTKIDLKIQAFPVATDKEGALRFLLREPDNDQGAPKQPPQRGGAPQQNTKLDVLHARAFMVSGEQRTAWTVVGVAWLHDRGVDVKLWYKPVAVQDDGTVRLFLREPSEEDQQRAQQRRQQPQQGRPQVQQQGRSQHRDQFQRPQQGTFGGAARAPDPGPQPPTYEDPDDSNIPF